MRFVDVPEVGMVPISPHGAERMRERRIAPEAVRTAILSNRRKWEAARSLASGLVEGAIPIRVVFPTLTVVLGKFEGEVCIVTLYRDGEG